MRMWMVDPRCLCRKHLLGEHLECGHMLPGAINHKKIESLRGLARDGFIQIGKIKERHAVLVEEMQRRGYNHKSPLPEFVLDGIPHDITSSVVDSDRSVKDLVARCSECKAKFLGAFYG